jgi:hypothetical protein
MWLKIALMANFSFLSRTDVRSCHLDRGFSWVAEGRGGAGSGAGSFLYILEISVILLPLYLK